jgi:riboflavin kinase/FMN adenylyltransferase
MIVVRHASSLHVGNLPYVIALGGFDGVHLGHAAVLRQLAETARRCGSTTMVVSSLRRNLPALGSLRQRIYRVAEHGVDVLYVAPGALQSSPVDVVAALPRGIRIRAFVGGAADTPLLERVGREREASIETLPMCSVDGGLVSSAAIRSAIARGELERARRMLGRAYAIGGRVVHGLRRGNQLGFPTANLRVSGVQLPPNGVYAVRARIGSDVRDGVANLGFNPTFANAERSLETHIFALDADLYGRYMEVMFVAYLRGERKFPSIDALIEQIRLDATEARRLLS